MNTLNGLKVITSEYCVERGEPFEERRSWRERLFSRPWRPLKATRTVVPMVPMKGGYSMAGGVIVLHPEMWRKLQAPLPAAREAQGANAAPTSADGEP